MNTKREYFASPVYVDLSITNACNFQCLYCYAEASPMNSIHMPCESVEKIVKECEEIGVSYIRIAGGEPLVHPDIKKILDICGNAKLLSSISTNASLIDDNMAKTIKASGLDWVVVSLDGHNKKVHNETRAGFDATINGLRRLIQNGVKTRVACVVSQYNYRYIPEIIEFAEKMGVCSIGFILFSQIGRAIGNLAKLSLKYDSLCYIVQCINNYRKNATKEQIPVNLIFPHESIVPWELSMFISDKDIELYWGGKRTSFSRTLGCKAAISTCAISAEGKVFGCEQLMSFSEMAAGDMNNDTLMNIWNTGESFKMLRSIDIEDLNDGCSNCSRTGCGGGCRAIVYGQTHNIKESCRQCMELV